MNLVLWCRFLGAMAGAGVSGLGNAVTNSHPKQKRQINGGQINFWTEDMPILTVGMSND